jgi:uncharacterized protein (DUF1330 family)
MAKGYILAEIDVSDPARFDTYRPLAAAAIGKYDGRYLVRGGEPRTLEGSRQLKRTVLLEFPSPERAMAFYNSPEYQAALKIRLESSTAELFVLTGHEG